MLVNRHYDINLRQRMLSTSRTESAGRRRNSLYTIDIDDSTIRLAQQGDKEAFAEIYEKYQPNLYRFVFKRVEHPEEAEDIVAQTFVQALANISKTGDNLNIHNWLYRIASNTCISYLRHKKCLKIQSLDSTVQLWSRVDGEDPEASAIANETALEVRTALNRIKPRYRRVLILREYQQLSYDEVAERMNAETRGTIKSLIFRAREAFCQQFNNYSRA